MDTESRKLGQGTSDSACIMVGRLACSVTKVTVSHMLQIQLLYIQETQKRNVKNHQ